MNLPFAQTLGDALKAIAIELATLLEEIQTTHSATAIAVLLGFSFLYGLVHAAGPGHGKTLVASYYGAQDKSYKNAIGVAFIIALVHTFSAFIITYVLYFLFQHIIAVAMEDVSMVAAKVSGCLIVGIGVYLFVGKFKHYRHQKSTPKWSTQPTSACSCASCKQTGTSTDIVLVLAAGLVPCPGTITVFLFSISLGLNFIGFLSALTMSLGMGLIIAITALISTSIRSSSKRNYSTLLKVLDIGSTLVIITLGVLIVVAS